jgi:hypothetical protein
MKKVLLIATSILLTMGLWGQQYPYQNPDLSSGERAKDLVSRLTLEEKATLMCDQSDAIPRLGIKKFNWWSEALHGYANNDSVTVFPEPIGMAASFNDQLLYEIFNAVSDEARAKYNHWLQLGNENKRFLSLSVWTPNVNIFRDPRWGRGQETYGEDPYLMSRMGVQVVKGWLVPSTTPCTRVPNGAATSLTSTMLTHVNFTKPTCLHLKHWFRRPMYARLCVPTNALMMNLVAATPACCSAFYATNGASNIWWCRTAAR